MDQAQEHLSFPTIFRDVRPCSRANNHRRFGATYFILLVGFLLGFLSTVKMDILPASCWFLTALLFNTEDWNSAVPRKHRSDCAGVHWATSQKTQSLQCEPGCDGLSSSSLANVPAPPHPHATLQSVTIVRSLIIMSPKVCLMRPHDLLK
jgi:hypothetical protein